MSTATPDELAALIHANDERFAELIYRLIAHGLPAPEMVRYRGRSVQVAHEDLAAWLEELDVTAGSWDISSAGDLFTADADGFQLLCHRPHECKP